MSNPVGQKSLRAMKLSFLWGGLALGITWILYRLFNNTGWILDDELSHYLFSRSVWENHEQIFNHWTRPGRNMVHFVAAPLGFTATRLYTFGLALVSIWITALVAKKLKITAVWAIPVLMLFQSWFPELSYPVLTQTPFMLFWILGIWFGLNRKYWHWAGFCFGYLSLIRHEGILITGLWGLWVTFQEGGFGRRCIEAVQGRCSDKDVFKALGRDSLYGLSTVSAIICYNLAAYLIEGSKPYEIYFAPKPTDMYGSGPIYHYVPLLIGGVGLFSIILSACGLLKLKGRWAQWSLPLLTYIMYFVVHSLIFWRGAFASGGYYHFLMPMAPLFALLGAHFIGVFLKQGPLPRWKFVSVLAILSAIIYQGVNMAHHQVVYQDWEAINQGDKEQHYGLVAKPMEKGELSQRVVDASQWVAENYPEDTLVLASHVAHPFTQSIWATKERVDLENSPLFKLPQGTVFIWDAGYSDNQNRTKFSSFTESTDWKPVKYWGKAYPKKEASTARDKYVVVVFEKVSALDTQDKVYEESAPKDEYDKAYGAE
ncbi:hypothetical protein Rhal01_00461 [Rubritalea halochordaticola]|uniref:Glycosyltransferase RgtA/B/C/D-like domain-containing protein n=1 Tax=Rubritalea halochordaticola TaxID=714537 RepID=A0ABP9UZN4_9BACT